MSDDLVTVTLGPDLNIKDAVSRAVEAAGDDPAAQQLIQVITGGLRPALVLPRSVAARAGLTPDSDDTGEQPTGSRQATEIMGVEPGLGAQDTDTQPTQVPRSQPAKKTTPAKKAARSGGNH